MREASLWWLSRSPLWFNLILSVVVGVLMFQYPDPAEIHPLVAFGILTFGFIAFFRWVMAIAKSGFTEDYLNDLVK